MAGLLPDCSVKIHSADNLQVGRRQTHTHTHTTGGGGVGGGEGLSKRERETEDLSIVNAKGLL